MFINEWFCPICNGIGYELGWIDCTHICKWTLWIDSITNGGLMVKMTSSRIGCWLSSMSLLVSVCESCGGISVTVALYVRSVGQMTDSTSFLHSSRTLDPLIGAQSATTKTYFSMTCQLGFHQKSLNRVRLKGLLVWNKDSIFSALGSSLFLTTYTNTPLRSHGSVFCQGQTDWSV